MLSNVFDSVIKFILLLYTQKKKHSLQAQILFKLREQTWSLYGGQTVRCYINASRSVACTIQLLVVLQNDGGILHKAIKFLPEHSTYLAPKRRML